jgi:hypothetical protein
MEELAQLRTAIISSVTGLPNKVLFYNFSGTL